MGSGNYNHYLPRVGSYYMSFSINFYLVEHWKKLIMKIFSEALYAFGWPFISSYAPFGFPHQSFFYTVDFMIYMVKKQKKQKKLKVKMKLNITVSVVKPHDIVC